MGNTLAIMQRDLSEAGTTPAKDAKETLDRLEDMAADRIDLFYDKIGHSERDKHLIPINKVLTKYTYIGVAVAESDGWIQGVKDAVQEFSSGPFAEGLTLAGTNAITKMFGSCYGKIQTTEGYVISIDLLGGISRLDYYILTYTFACSGLAEKKASLVACCVVESSADIGCGLDANTMRVLISRTFKGMGVPRSLLTAMHTQVVTAMKATTENLTLTSEQEQSLASWYKSADQKLVTGGATDGNDGSAANGDGTNGEGQVEVA